jgi:hypothetical protein
VSNILCYAIVREQEDELIEMLKLSLTSARKNLVGLERVVIMHTITTPIDSLLEVDPKVEELILTPVKEENFLTDCGHKHVSTELFPAMTAGLRRVAAGNNVLYLDCDTLMVRPVEVFGKYSDFRLFGDSILDWGFPEPLQFHLNSGVKYLPETMDPALWEYGDELWKRNNNTWGYEQGVFNRIFQRQAGITRESISSELNDSDVKGNNHPKEGVKILHFHEVRQSLRQTLDRMLELWKLYGGRVYPYQLGPVILGNVGYKTLSEVKELISTRLG